MNTIVAEMPKANLAAGNAGKDKGPDDGKQVTFDDVLKGQKEHPAEKDKKQDTDTDDGTAVSDAAGMLTLPYVPGAAQAAGDMCFILPAAEGKAKSMAEATVSGPVGVDIPAVITADADRHLNRVSDQTAMAFNDGTTKESAVKNEIPEIPTETIQGFGKPAQQKTEQAAVQLTGRKAEETDAAGVYETRDNPERNAEAVKSSVFAERTVEYNPVAREITTAPKPAHDQEIRTEYMDMLKGDIAKQIASGKQHIEIQLHPDNLGTLVIKASCEAGKAVISIVCSEAKTMQAMSQQARELAGIVEARTGNETQVIVERPSEDYLQQQQQQEQHSGRQEREPDRQQRDSHKGEFQESFDFLQQLRLGLA